jgi:hypothetical protein
MAVIWVVELRNLVEVYRSFRGLCCLLHHFDEALMPNIIKALCRYIAFLYVITLLVCIPFDIAILPTNICVFLADKAPYTSNQSTNLQFFIVACVRERALLWTDRSS